MCRSFCWRKEKITAAAAIMDLVKNWAEISSVRLVENLRAVQAVANRGASAAVETLAVVKANGYGHDAALVARVLVDVGWASPTWKRARSCERRSGNPGHNPRRDCW